MNIATKLVEDIIEQWKKAYPTNRKPKLVSFSEIDFTPKPEVEELKAMIDALSDEDFAEVYALMAMGREGRKDFENLKKAGMALVKGRYIRGQTVLLGSHLKKGLKLKRASEF